MTSSPSVDFYTTAEASDLNGCDVTAVNDCRAAAADGRRDSRAMRLKQTYLYYFSYIVCAINSAFASWTKLQRFLEVVLRLPLRNCRQRIPEGKLRVRIRALYSESRR